jgi:hypothetical protein
MRFPASSWDKPSKSTRRSASSSVGSMTIGGLSLWGTGVNPVRGGILSTVMGLGCLPRCPRRCLHRRGMVVYFMNGTFIYFVHIHNNKDVHMHINNKRGET